MSRRRLAERRRPRLSGAVPALNEAADLPTWLEALAWRSLFCHDPWQNLR